MEGNNEIRVGIGGKESSFTALHDTGNTLRNPVDGRPVLVMEQAAVMDLLPAADAAILREKPTPEIAMARLYAAGSRLHFTLLPYRSVGRNPACCLRYAATTSPCTAEGSPHAHCPICRAIE